MRIKCQKCLSKFDDDEHDVCPVCETPVVNQECPDCQGVWDPTIYGEDNCPYCHGG